MDIFFIMEACTISNTRTDFIFQNKAPSIYRCLVAFREEMQWFKSDPQEKFIMTLLFGWIISYKLVLLFFFFFFCLGKIIKTQGGEKTVTALRGES